ncbi:hypothetical protein B0H19DRAFT_281129 [Mycena capillaripes]|nr:hypothetical protein B0H19DRAFT_281129 [Mycena capillaripes]
MPSVTRSAIPFSPGSDMPDVARDSPFHADALDVFISRCWQPSLIEAKVHTLETSLSRSGSCPLSISLECRTSVRLEPLIHAIVAHCWRLQHLKLRVHLGHLRSLESSLLSLRSLIIWVQDPDDNVPTAVIGAPLLHRVALQRYHRMLSSILPWIQLTVLIVGLIGRDEYVHMLNLVPNLVYCRITIYENEQPMYVSSSSSDLFY